MDTLKPISLLIIYTGGTIGMVRDQETGSLHPFQLDSIVDEIPDLKKTNFHLSTYSFTPLLDSSNVNPEIWIKLAEIIEENYKHFDGFVVLHGTDTMSFSAAALSFMLESLDKPVVFTGSQLPIGLLRTDAKENLVSAIEIAASKRGNRPTVPEVSIFFQDKLFRGNRTLKHNAEEFHAFQSYNYPPLAESGVHIRFNYSAIHYPDKRKSFAVNKDIDSNVTILKLYPGISREVVRAMHSVEGLKGIILETYGSGNAPSDSWFLEEVEIAINKGIVLMSVTQCAEGCVEMGMYDTSKALEKMGVISGHDITTEAALTKLMVLFGKHKEPADIIKDLNRSLRGEISIS